MKSKKVLWIYRYRKKGEQTKEKEKERERKSVCGMMKEKESTRGTTKEREKESKELRSKRYNLLRYKNRYKDKKIRVWERDTDQWIERCRKIRIKWKKAKEALWIYR